MIEKLALYCACSATMFASFPTAGLADTAYDGTSSVKLSFQNQCMANPWERLQSAGINACNRRSFDEAEKLLLKAIREAKKLGTPAHKLLESRLALGRVYIAKNDTDEARRLFDWCLLKSKRLYGPESLQYGQALDGLAEVNLLVKNYEQAEECSKQALAIKEKLLGCEHQDYARSLVTLANTTFRQAFYTDARPLYHRALTILEKNPGFNKLDYADALRDAGIYYQCRGQKADARKYFDSSHKLKSKATIFDQSPELNGSVLVQWEEGSPQAEIIPDIDFPLKYICVNNVRVAVTVVDLWELMGVLIAVTNISDHKMELALGKVTVERPELVARKARYLQYVDPNTIDSIRRERVIWDLTQNRPWLANIQKTRSVRGLVPAHGHDLFRGPNIFGVYRNWNVSQRILPDRFAIEASPERVQYQTEAGTDPDIIHTAHSNLAGLCPVSLEPFESRTGVLFYLHPRCEQILLKIPVGNAIFEFPFNCRKKRIN